MIHLAASPSSLLWASALGGPGRLSYLSGSSDGGDHWFDVPESDNAGEGITVFVDQRHGWFLVPARMLMQTTNGEAWHFLNGDP
ncbi:MAG TPA: hypothetical protein VGL60_05130 [Acidimicrobiales bacterium]|jgi:hypothetical protein